MTPLALIMIIAAYLLGSISSAVLICRVLRLPDPRT
ncbi:glycerol-3-phosphate acyltransferase, partial [Vibrio crassostreae]